MSIHPDQVLDAAQVSSELVNAWDDLAESTGGSYFQSGTWALAWWEHLAGRPETKVALWHGPDGSLEAVCAISQIRQPLLGSTGPRVAVWTNTGSGAGAGDHLGWPALTDVHRTAQLDWSIGACSGPVMLSNLASDRIAGLAGRGFDLIEMSPTLAAPLGSGEDWFPGSNDFRKKLRYYGRQLDKAGVKLDVLDATRIDQDLFDRLLELHAVRSEHMGWGTFFDTDRRSFHMDLIGRGRPGRGPAMCVARRDDEVIGILYGFRFGSTFSYFQTGWSSEYVKLSLGSVLVWHTMEWAVDHGATTFDFLRGDDEYKRRFGAEPRSDTTWMLARGAAGKALRTRRTAADRLKRKAS